MQLSRSSKVYQFVFSSKELPEPEDSQIPVGVFGILFLLSVVAVVFEFLFFRVFGSIVGLLTGGWYFQLKGQGMEIKEINPWPTVQNVRFPPGILLVFAIVAYTSYIGDVEGTASIVIALIFMYILRPRRGDTSLAEELAEKHTPHVNRRIVRAYKKKALLFSPIQLVD